MSAQKARVKKLLLGIQKECTEETNNPESALFLKNQFPESYEENYALPLAASTSNNNSFEVCYAHQVSAETYSIEALNLSDDQILALNNTDTLHYEFVKDVIIEETIVTQPKFQNNSPSLLSDFEQSCNLNNNVFFMEELTANGTLPGDDVTILPIQEGVFEIQALNYAENHILPCNVPSTSSNYNQEETLLPQTPKASSQHINKLVSYSDTDSEADEPKIKRKKRCQVKKEEWAGEVNKKNREKGKKYLGKKKICGEWKKDIEKPERILKPRCSCKEKKGVIQCHLISEEDREKLFDKFWAMSWDEKRIFTENLVKVIHTNRQRDRKKPDESKRTCTFVYYLKKGEEPIRVCKTLFLNTLSIGKSCIWSWKTQPKTPDGQIIKTTQPTKKPFDKELKTLQNFLDELPKMPSHYCRKRTTQSYLQPDIATKRQLYDIYKQYCLDKNTNSLSIATFSNALSVQSISIFKPKKDLCDICNGYKLGNIRKDDYDIHVAKKEEARAEKESDKVQQEFVFTVDLQAVLLAPRSNVSSHYYKTKLCVHNFCIYDMKSGEGYCFLWNETEGGLNSDEFATIISTFLIEIVILKMGHDNREIILYSDGCTYQNRNTVLTNALINVAMLYNVTITHKYLEVGHTQMEVDSMHAMIEKKLKNQTINVPAEYITICKKAKKTKPYHVKYLNFTYFKSFKDISFYKSIRPGNFKGDPKVTDLRCLKYDPSGKVFYKLRFPDEYTLLNQRRNKTIHKTPFENIPQLYNERRKITKKKYLDLQHLKNSMPEDYRNYYDNLPYED